MTCLAFGAWCARPGRGFVASAAWSEFSAAQPTALETPAPKNCRRVRLRWKSLKRSIDVSPRLTCRFAISKEIAKRRATPSLVQHLVQVHHRVDEHRPARQCLSI